MDTDMNLVLQICGWAGSFCYAVSVIPQAYTSIKQGHSDGVNPWFMLLMIMGGIGSLLFISPHITENLPLVMNFVCSALAASIVLFYCFHRRKSKKK